MFENKDYLFSRNSRKILNKFVQRHAGLKIFKQTETGARVPVKTGTPLKTSRSIDIGTPFSIVIITKSPRFLADTRQNRPSSANFAFCNFHLSLPASTSAVTLASDLTNEKVAQWDEFLAACNGFGNDHLYVLVTDSEIPEGNGDILKYLGTIGWSIIFDFDSNTENPNGLYGAASKLLGEVRSLYLVTIDDKLSFNPTRAAYWYAARGLAGRASTLPEDDSWRQWNRKYSSKIEAFLTDFGAATDTPIIVVVSSKEYEYCRKICELIDQTLGDRVRFVFTGKKNSTLEALASEYAGDMSIFGLSSQQMAIGLKGLRGGRFLPGDHAYLPSNSDLPVLLSPKEHNWIEEEMTVVHLDCGVFAEDGRKVGRDFLRGGQISWFELGLHIDVERTKQLDLQTQISEDLVSRLNTRINLYHFPGSGGTTLGLRLAWLVHKRFPTVVLHKYSEQTVQRLQNLYLKTGSSIFVVVENHNVSDDELEKLYAQSHSDHLPIVFLLISRRFKSIDEGSRTFYLREELDREEANRFSRVYANEQPGQAYRLQKLEEATGHERTPFYFGLTAFQEDFTRLESYVGAHLNNLSDVERKLLCYLGLAYKYAQKRLPAQVFAGILGFPGSRSVKLERVLSEERTGILINDGENGWRPSHYLIAKEMVELILSGSGPRNNWRDNLSTWAAGLLDDLSKLRVGQTERMSDFALGLVSDIFVVRDHNDVLTDVSERAKFAPLIADIPSTEGKFTVFERLVDCFSTESHFYGHFARFLSSEDENQRALDTINIGLDLRGADQDDVLHHIKGVVLRNWASSKIRRIQPRLYRKEPIPAEEIEEILRLSSESEAEFSISRELAPNEEYGYVSHVQLLVKIVDFGFQVSGAARIEDFLGDARNLRYQEMVERAELILADVKRLRRGSSKFVVDCEDRISQLYGDYTTLLQRWNSMLDRRDISRPPIRRRLCFAYLGQRDRQWDSLQNKEVKRIFELMEENMIEEPDNDKNIGLWFQAGRRLSDLSQDKAIEKLLYLHANTHSLLAAYYLTIIYSLKAIDGSDVARQQAENWIGETKKRARHIQGNTAPLEWYGKGKGIDLTRIIPRARLGQFVEDKNFYEHEDLLTKLAGKITKADRPEAGEIELRCGLKAFFIPRRAQHRPDLRIFTSQDVNKDVDFYIAFSYEGLRAWSVDFRE